MSKNRKDSKGRVLLRGESQRKTKPEYVYSYYDPYGKRRFIYASSLQELRKKKDILKRDQLDGIDVYAAGKSDINYVFDRYMSAKVGLRPTTRDNYIYMYEKYVRSTFGKRKIAEVKYSDVKAFYLDLVNKTGLSINSLHTVHSVLYPVFELAVRDDIIRKNPSYRIMDDIVKSTGRRKGRRKALTVEEQKAFMNYILDNPYLFKWWSVFTVLFETGLRAGEFIGLRWDDVDFEKGIIDINHAVIYTNNRYSNKRSEFILAEPKTECGKRTVPMTENVRLALNMEYEKQKEEGFNTNVVDGMSGFIFQNAFGNLYNSGSLTTAIKRIVHHYNADEILKASKQRREPVLLPNFSVHITRHTFCVRLCELDVNLKAIQAIMGHADIRTTMDIYAECTDAKKKESIAILNSNLKLY